MTANSLLFLKSHVSAFTRKDGTFVAAHDDKRVHHEGDSVKVTGDVEGHGMTGVIHESSSGGQYHIVKHSDGSKASYHSSDLSPHNDDDDDDDDNPSLFKSHVSAFTRKDGTFVAAHDDKRQAAVPPISAHHKDLAAFAENESSEDKYHLREASEHMKNGNHKELASMIKRSDPFQKQQILEHIHPDHWESLGAKPANKERVMSIYNKKFNQRVRTARGKGAGRAYTGNGAGNLKHADVSDAGSKTDAPPANADVNEKHWGDTLSDDDNPTYAMRNLESTHLGHIASGKVDAKRLAHEELARRGQDSDGKWVGFDKAKEHHAALKGKSKPHPSNARVAEHLQSVGSDILSSVAKGHIDMKKRADAELDNRNHDRNGNWIKKT